jgi:hypothetical protein
VYVRGSFASREPVYGLSDVDLVLVLPESLEIGAAKRARDRWQQLVSTLPLLGRLAALAIYREADLAETARGCLLTYRLGTPGAGTVTARRAATGSSGLALRPGLYAAAADWRRVAGPERRPETTPPSGADRWAPAWLELQCWWRYAFWACREQDPWTVADLCVKLVAEPARIWLWIEHGLRCRGRLEALERALPVLPDEEGALRLALELRRNLTASRVPPLAETLGYIVRMSQRLAERLARDAAEASPTSVRLAPASGTKAGLDETLPLVDWRARVFPDRPDERFLVMTGVPTSSADLARAAGADIEPGPRPALIAPSLLVLPTFDLETRPLIRGALRAVQSADTDPVSFAILAGKPTAAFPSIVGLAAQDGARRAAASHAAWLHGFRATGLATARLELGMLLSCARAAVFSESVQSGDSELPLTIAAIIEALGAREPSMQAAVETIAGEYLSGAESTESGTAAAAVAARLEDRLLRAAQPDPARTI